MHTVCMGAAELSFENEVRHPIPHIIPFQQIFQLFSEVRSIFGIPIYQVESFIDRWSATSTP